MTVEVEELGGGWRRVSYSGDSETPEQVWETRYPSGLIELIGKAKGLEYVCDEIRRDEDPTYVQKHLRLTLLGHLDERAFTGGRLLDFGCGCGSSTVNLARMFEGTEIVGVELVPEFVEIARQRAEFYGLENLTFELSPGGDSLPADLGEFDFVLLSAVFEHMLPAERTLLLPAIWSHLGLTGVLFINQLPHRYSPVEGHTTGLPLINFLPERAAHALSTRFSPRVEPGASWETLLRAGIRGGSVGEVLEILESDGSSAPRLLEPTRLGLSDRVDLWFELSAGTRLRVVKRAIWVALKALRRISKRTFVPDLAIAIEKLPRG